MRKLEELARLGQSIWYDYIQRGFLERGELQDLVAKGVRGVTSNPAIFEKAIAGTGDYDAAIRLLAEQGKSAREIYETVAMEDVARAADQLRPVYERTGGGDGYVSLEVSPTLAHDTSGTVEEGKRLFAAVARPNLMIKVPATESGIPAIAELVGSGVNVNVTLLFGVANYLDVADAYMQGLERLADAGPEVVGGHTVDKVASVASFFVSRVDTAVDTALGELGNESLQGKIAVANAKRAYGEFRRLVAGDRWRALANRGGNVQRLLWASTGTKNARYSDTLYVDELIGPDTVNTAPPATLEAFLDHGKVALTIAHGSEEAEADLEELASAGVDLAKITQGLQEAGVASFAGAFESLLAGVSQKTESLLSGTGRRG
jgi:transaldolase